MSEIIYLCGKLLDKHAGYMSSESLNYLYNVY